MRAERASRRTPAQPISLVGSIRALVGGGSDDVSAVAGAFVRGMDAAQDEVERAHDAFLLDPGMGPMAYLTADGRVLLDFRTFDGEGIREASDDDAIASLVVGVKKTGIAALLDLLPPSPIGAAVCASCEGTRWMTLNPNDSPIVCLSCRGRGWQIGTASTCQ